MYGQSCLALVLVVFFAVVQKGHGLQCWMCTSEKDVTCRDYFNVTRIKLHQNYVSNYGNRQVQPVRSEPHELICDDMYTTSHGQKNVCLKAVYKGSNDNSPPIVRRGCRLVPQNTKMGDCPAELIDRNLEMEFCEICDGDNCNSSTNVRTNLLLTGVMSLILILALRK